MNPLNERSPTDIGTNREAEFVFVYRIAGESKHGGDSVMADFAERLLELGNPMSNEERLEIFIEDVEFPRRGKMELSVVVYRAGWMTDESLIFVIENALDDVFSKAVKWSPNTSEFIYGTSGTYPYVEEVEILD